MVLVTAEQFLVYLKMRLTNKIPDVINALYYLFG